MICRIKRGKKDSLLNIFCEKIYRLYPPNNSSPQSPDNYTVTCFLSIWDTKNVGIWDESAKGSS